MKSNSCVLSTAWFALAPCGRMRGAAPWDCCGRCYCLQETEVSNLGVGTLVWSGRADGKKRAEVLALGLGLLLGQKLVKVAEESLRCRWGCNLGLKPLMCSWYRLCELLLGSVPAISFDSWMKAQCLQHLLMAESCGWKVTTCTQSVFKPSLGLGVCLMHFAVFVFIVFHILIFWIDCPVSLEGDGKETRRAFPHVTTVNLRKTPTHCLSVFSYS